MIYLYERRFDGRPTTRRPWSTLLAPTFFFPFCFRRFCDIYQIYFKNRVNLTASGCYLIFFYLNSRKLSAVFAQISSEKFLPSYFFGRNFEKSIFTWMFFSRNFTENLVHHCFLSCSRSRIRRLFRFVVLTSHSAKRFPTAEGFVRNIRLFFWPKHLQMRLMAFQRMLRQIV